MFWLSFVVNIPILIFLAHFFAERWNHQPLRRFYYPALLFKILTGIGIGVIFMEVYKGVGDTITAFKSSALFNDLLFNDPKLYFRYFFFSEPDLDQYLQDGLSKAPRAVIFVKVLAIINIISFNNYWITGAYLSLFSFLGLYCLANTIVRIFKIPLLSALISFLFFPSVIFWSSGIMKETILMSAIGFLVAFILSWNYENKNPGWKIFLLMVLSTWVIYYMKFYYFALLIPAITSLVFTRQIIRLQLFKEKRLVQPFVFLLIFGVITLSATLLHPQLRLATFLQSLVDNYEVTIVDSNRVNVIFFPGLRPEWLSLLEQFPKAVFAGLFRPLPGDIQSVLGYAVMADNVIIVLFFVISLIHLFRKRPTFSDPILFTAVSVYIIGLAFILPIASPNWGGLERYKIGYLIFFLVLITFRNPLIIYLEQRFLKEKEDAR